MSIEVGIAQEKKNKEIKKLSDEEKTFEKIKQQQFLKQKSKAEIHLAIEKELFELQELLGKGEYNEHTSQLITKLIASNSISPEEIESIFEIIDSLEENTKIDEFLPKEMRITKQEYKDSITDENTRNFVMIKLDAALTHISRQINSDSGGSINLFSGFMALLDKNLIALQEGNIDIKNSLEKIGNQKKNTTPELNKSLLSKIIDFLKSLIEK